MRTVLLVLAAAAVVLAAPSASAGSGDAITCPADSPVPACVTAGAPLSKADTAHACVVAGRPDLFESIPFACVSAGSDSTGDYCLIAQSTANEFASPPVPYGVCLPI